ncbi:MAG: response regulator transcription factor [Phycisphaerae bacterium]|nr:response regulator transcription factor [Phycisphaerae bacterium]
MKRITVLLVEDHTVVREGLRALLDIEGGFDVIGEAADGVQAVDLARELRPDVVVMDIAMPRLNGMEAARRILQEGTPPPKVLILSAHGDDVYIEKVASLGVAGYLVKQTSAHRLAEAIREIQKGNAFYSPSVAERVREYQEAAPGKVPRFSRAGRPGRKPKHLTPREYEVLQLVAEGWANKQIAADLGISIKTVEKHRQRVMEKLDIHETAGLTRYAVSAGLVESSVQVTVI